MPSNFNMYTINPQTRYAQFKKNFIEISQILHLYETDDKSKITNYLKNDHSNSLKNEIKNNPNHFFSLNSPKLIGLNSSFNS